MKNLKKVLALVVVFAMMMTTVAFASYPDVDTTADYAGAVELLSALEVLKGDDQGNFNPDNTITRAEFAAVVCRALGLENSANSAKGATIFTDVAADHWATGYINLASQQGIINGKGNGIFDPEGNVTFAEAVKMLVVAIGYEPMAAQRGGYPTGYLTVANSTKMTAGVSASGTDAAALRSTVAMLTANAMEIPVMDQTGYGTEITYEVLDNYDDYTTLLTNMDIYVATGVVGDTDNDQDTVEFTLSEASDDYEFGYNTKGEVLDKVEDGKAVYTFDIADSNIESYYQQNVKAYVYKAAKSDYEVVIAVPSGIGATLTINSSDLDVSNAKIGDEKVAVEYYETSDATKTTKIYVDEDATVYVNGVLTSNVADLAIFADEDATIEFVENSDDKYYDNVLVTVYTNAIVEEVKADDPEFLQIALVDGKKIELDLTDEDVVIEIVDKDGNAMELADFAEYDVLAVVVGDLAESDASKVGFGVKAVTEEVEKIKIINLGQSSVTGSITEASDDYIYIDGTEYEVGAFVDYNDVEVFDDVDDPSTAKLGTEGMFFISATGKIIGFDGEAGANANYGFILQTNLNTQGFEDGWEIMMLTAEGTSTYTLYTTVSLNGTSIKPTSTEGATAIAAALDDFDVADQHKATADDRIVEYKLTADGKIKTLKFLSDVDAIAADSEFKVKTNKIGGKLLSENIIVFDVSNDDADDCKVMDISSLVDEGKYAGFVAGKKNSEYKILVMTAGSAKFEAEGALMFVESIRKSTYGADDAITVKYLTEGSKTAQDAIFVDTEANKVYGGAYDFEDLNKGSIFVANVNADGLVSDYAVLAVMGSDYDFDVDVDVLEAMNTEDEDVQFMYGYISNIDKRIVSVTDYVGYAEGEFTTNEAFNAYQFNTRIKNPTVEAGSWEKNGVGNTPKNDNAYPVFIKLFDGDVIDVYTSAALIEDALVGAEEDETPVVPTVTLSSIAVEVSAIELAAGYSAADEEAAVKAAVKVTATYSDESTEDVTAEATVTVDTENNKVSVEYEEKTAEAEYAVTEIAASTEAVVEDEVELDFE
ncbi:MAG: S-layer homology domain-containing protein [Clostridia bacterium]|nr:S-layer homology domain-containing protein [Clostridia bacterium]